MNSHWALTKIINATFKFRIVRFDFLRKRETIVIFWDEFIRDVTLKFRMLCIFKRNASMKSSKLWTNENDYNKFINFSFHSLSCSVLVDWSDAIMANATKIYWMHISQKILIRIWNADASQCKKCSTTEQKQLRCIITIHSWTRCRHYKFAQMQNKYFGQKIHSAGEKKKLDMQNKYWKAWQQNSHRKEEGKQSEAKKISVHLEIIASKGMHVQCITRILYYGLCRLYSLHRYMWMWMYLSLKFRTSYVWTNTSNIRCSARYDRYNNMKPFPPYEIYPRAHDGFRWWNNTPWIFPHSPFLPLCGRRRRLYISPSVFLCRSLSLSLFLCPVCAFHLILS